MKIGKFLRDARLEKGLTTGQISRELFIQERYLLALEEGNYEVIPGEAYQRAYFKKYADYLGVGEHIDNLTKSRQIEPEAEEQSMDDIFGGKWDQARWIRVIAKIAAIILIPTFIVLGVKAAQNKGGDNPADGREQVSGTHVLEVVPTDTAERSWSIPDSGATGDTPSGTNTPDQLNNMSHMIKLTATGECWVTVHTRDEKLYEGMMVAGDDLTFTDLVGFQISAGAPQKLDVEFDGESIPWETGQTDMTLPSGASLISDSTASDSADDTPDETTSTDNTSNADDSTDNTDDNATAPTGDGSESN
jgi:hypothetical protein